MGPLEIEQRNDSGVHMKRKEDFHSEPPIPGLATIMTAEAQVHSRQHTHHPSSSTLVSDSSQSSSTSVEPSSVIENSDKSNGTDDSSWGGDHPLLLGYTAEPENMVDNSEDGPPRGYDITVPLLQSRPASLRHKGHSMSMDSHHQESTKYKSSEIAFNKSGSGARRRRNKSKEAEDDNSTPHADANQGHSSAAAEAVGKRVIIHQVTITDTLAGIALYYGIQVAILKKCNKLWTNDSIHTHKYLYIPFEECTVTRQAGVTIDESNQTVILPQRIQQQQHARAGSLIATSSYHGHLESSPVSPMTTASANGRGYLHAVQEASSASASASGQRARLTSDMDNSMVPPPISAVTAGMLPSSSQSASATATPRLGTWIDPKSEVAPPLPSHALTTTTLKANNSLGATPLAPRRANTFIAGIKPATATVPISETLPNTVLVPPSMTHEALAARFKEMDMVSSEQQHRKSMALGQELRINPVHHRHRTTDLRQSRKSSSDASAQETSFNSRAPLTGKSGAESEQQNDGCRGVNGSYRVIEEEEDDYRGRQQQEQEQEQGENGFVTYGHHQHFYQADDVPTSGSGVDTGLEGREHKNADENITTLLLDLEAPG
ncbi:hypothetical protein BGX28_001979 [Mortierella sp. GBA30]|nr:hypothetical protein BGX28_001979 [Mortierella sp. GBA30]